MQNIVIKAMRGFHSKNDVKLVLLEALKFCVPWQHVDVGGSLFFSTSKCCLTKYAFQKSLKSKWIGVDDHAKIIHWHHSAAIVRTVRWKKPMDQWDIYVLIIDMVRWGEVQCGFKRWTIYHFVFITTWTMILSYSTYPSTDHWPWPWLWSGIWDCWANCWVWVWLAIAISIIIPSNNLVWRMQNAFVQIKYQDGKDVWIYMYMSPHDHSNVD